MFKQSYSEKDLIELTNTARTIWEIDLQNKIIKRKLNVIDKKLPLQAIYRMVVDDWASNKNNEQNFEPPFVSSSFRKIIGFKKGWHISVEDRKFIEKDMYLFADDSRTILIDINIKRFWETSEFHIFSIFVGISGLIIGLLAYINC